MADPIKRAAELLRAHAQMVRDSETNLSGPRRGEITDPDAREEVAEHERLAAELEGSASSETSTPAAPAEQPIFVVKQPLLLMFEQEGHLTCHLYPQPEHTHEHYGLLIADLVTHVARHFEVEPDDVWDWVEKEYRRPTTDFRSPS